MSAAENRIKFRRIFPATTVAGAAIHGMLEALDGAEERCVKAEARVAKLERELETIKHVASKEFSGLPHHAVDRLGEIARLARAALKGTP